MFRGALWHAKSGGNQFGITIFCELQNLGIDNPIDETVSIVIRLSRRGRPVMSTGLHDNKIIIRDDVIYGD